MVSSKALKAVGAELARLLKAAREERGLSLSLVGERAGLSYQMVSYVERELRTPTVETLVRIASALEVDPAMLLDQAIKAAGK